MKTAIRILFLTLFATLYGCGHSDTYRVEGSVEDNASLNLRIITYGEGSITNSIIAAREGKFRFEGAAPGGRLIEIYDNDFRLLGRFFVENGEDIDVTLSKSNPRKISVSGNKLSERWAKFLADNSETLTSPGANDFVAGFVKENTTDQLSTLLMLTEYNYSDEKDVVRADSLFALIDHEARLGLIASGLISQTEHVGGSHSREAIEYISYRTRRLGADTLRTSAVALNLIAVTDEQPRRDTIADALRKIARHKAPGRLQVVDFSVASDTLIWQRSVAADSATWIQGWVPGGIASATLVQLGIPVTPYFIVTDSAGTQIWRGRSAKTAYSIIVENL